jgi:hypothetical protein
VRKGLDEPLFHLCTYGEGNGVEGSGGGALGGFKDREMRVLACPAGIFYAIAHPHRLTVSVRGAVEFTFALVSVVLEYRHGLRQETEDAVTYHWFQA